MKSEVKEVFSSIPNIEGDTMEQFIEILELPDEQFDAIYPQFKKNVSTIFSGEKFQKQLLEQMSTMPSHNIEEERNAIQSFVDMVKEDDTLSDNKKDFLEIIFRDTLETYEELLTNRRFSIGVKINKLEADAVIPTYAHSTDAGCDISSVESVTIPPNSTIMVRTGLAVAVPSGYALLVYPRSGLSAKTPLRIANSVGVIDTDYRGEIKVLLHNTSNENYTIEKGTKIAQFIITEVPMIKWTEVDDINKLGNTDRGEGGFGSTDTKS